LKNIKTKTTASIDKKKETMSAKKHILFIVENNSFPGDVRVYREALAAREFGYEVSVIAPASAGKCEKKFDIVDGIYVYRHPMPVEGGTKAGLLLEYANSLFWEFILTVKIFFQRPFHFIHSANPPDHIFILALLFKPWNVKYVFDHHDISPENYLAKFGRKDFLYRLLLIFERLTFMTADLVISTNESYKRLAVTRGGKNSDDVFVVRNGPDLSRVMFQPPNSKWKEGFDHLVGYVGTIGSQEGIDNLIRSVDYIVHKRGITNIKFIIVGSGTHLQNLVAYAASLGVSKYINFTGYIPYKDFYEVIATADVCVNPEFRNDFTDKSTMIKIMDYMVFGKPIIQYYTTEGEVTAGDAAVYVRHNDEIEFAEQLLALLNDPRQRDQRGQAAKKRMDELLHWDIQKANLKKAYDHLNEKCAEPNYEISVFMKLYYTVKDVLPRPVQLALRRLRMLSIKKRYRSVWPVDEAAGRLPAGWHGWPDNKKFALVLTHDIDTGYGNDQVPDLAKIELQLGFRSSFFFVPELYSEPQKHHRYLLDNGFEIGVHGLNHDGQLYASEALFNKKAQAINRYMSAWQASGFRSPCMHHNLRWLHRINAEYDASTYDTDPFEPQGGGVKTIFPFIAKNNDTGHSYVELPYTLPQDHLLFIVMQNQTIDIWKKKLDWIAGKGGMALFTVHPDYIYFGGQQSKTETYPVERYLEFLTYIKNTYDGQYWNVLARDMARFWGEEMGPKLESKV
jgi:glycosyltransferase involved in cell wall biosynthesis